MESHTFSPDAQYGVVIRCPACNGWNGKITVGAGIAVIAEYVTRCSQRRCPREGKEFRLTGLVVTRLH